jgi:DNA-directed RNA polymerase specialized sigma24 family protein
MTRARFRPSVPNMDRASALESLPEVYARALRLREEGCANDEIARRLSIAPEAVSSTLELAEAKLGRLMRLDGARREPRDRGR